MLVGGYGLSPVEFSDLFCPPYVSGTEVQQWDAANQSFTTYSYINGNWLPPGEPPALGVGYSEFVTVDTSVPAIYCPADIVTVGCPSTPVFYTVTASNAFGATWTPTVNPASGNPFSVGSTVVNCVVTNGCGGSNTCSFTVTVSCPGPTAGLLHRYSFASDASDSVGGANGTLVPPNGGAAAVINNGLSLAGGGGGGFSGYVTLPSGILTNTTNLTIECWVTQNQANTWAEIWDFGNNNNQNFGLIPRAGNNGDNMEVAFTPNGGEADLDTPTAFPNGSEQYVSVTYNNATLAADLYTNGVLDATTTLPNANYCPGTIGGAGGTAVNALGNDVYNDPQFQGTIYELRIWNGIVSPLYLAVSTVGGPGTVATNLTPVSLAVTVTNSTMSAGSSQQASATGNFAAASGVPVTGFVTNWSSSNPNVLTVNGSGLITAVNSGATMVSATLNGVTSTSAAIIVTSTPPVRLSVTHSGTNVMLSWPAGTLLQAPTVQGPWTTNTAAVSPCTIPVTNGSQFFKVLVAP
jgi:hypothetical protein